MKFVSTVLTLISLSSSPALAAGDCAALKASSFDADVGAKTTVLETVEVAATAELPAYCKLVGVIAPHNNVEIRLPKDTWSGRVLMAGCWNLCGKVEADRANDALARGYAIAHTDMGHDEPDLSFAKDAAKLTDYEHRSTHVTTLLLKAAARAYYGKPHIKSYFRGCSTGGRQGLVAALMYPQDYDGIAAGSPASGPTVPNIAWALKANTRADGSQVLDGRALEVLHTGVLAACDMDDNVKDGIIANPDGCAFEPKNIVCADPQKCLTAEQANTAGLIYGGVTGYASRGFAKGGELGWSRGIVSVDGKPTGMMMVAQYYLDRYARDPNPPRTLMELDFSKHPPRLEAVDWYPSFGADGKRLAALQKAGGKLLLTHSWADDQLTPATAIDFYEDHARAFGGRAALDPFFRMFIIPGMFHCGGGDGPDAVNLLTALESWVERGEAPSRLIAYKTKASRGYPGQYAFPLAPDNIVSARPLFPFPTWARYRGRGDINDPANWEAVD